MAKYLAFWVALGSGEVVVIVRAPAAVPVPDRLTPLQATTSQKMVTVPVKVPVVLGLKVT